MKRRPLGKILLDLEILIDEAVDGHELQFGDLLYWLYGHLKIHRPDAQEVYTDDKNHPEFYYGPKRR